MTDEITQLKNRLDRLHAKLAAYPTGVRPSWVSTDIAFDRMAIEAINKRLTVLTHSEELIEAQRRIDLGEPISTTAAEMGLVPSELEELLTELRAAA